jgi:hypothetical protein
MGDEMYQLFFPVAITVVIMIVLLVVLLVLQERSSARRQRVSATAFFAAQDPRWEHPPAVTAADREAALATGGRRPR